MKNATRILQETFRTSDIIARIGGDEFAVLLPKTDSDITDQKIQRIYSRLEEFNRAHPDLPVQFSIGASTAERGELMKTLVIADQRMYEDKARRKSLRN